MNTSQLSFHRVGHGLRADSLTTSYTIVKGTHGYVLKVYSQDHRFGLVLLGDELDYSHDELLRDSKAVANAYESLQNFNSVEHGHMNRMTVAVTKAYENV